MSAKISTETNNINKDASLKHCKNQQQQQCHHKPKKQQKQKQQQQQQQHLLTFLIDCKCSISSDEIGLPDDMAKANAIVTTKT